MSKIFVNQYPPKFTTEFVIGVESTITDAMAKYKMFPGYTVEASVYLYGKYALDSEYVHVRVHEPVRNVVINEFDMPSGIFARLVQNNVCSVDLGTQYLS